MLSASLNDIVYIIKTKILIHIYAVYVYIYIMVSAILIEQFKIGNDIGCLRE